uniref:Adenylate kinase n=2 Tax=Macrostomum lignano TaxID=282301 RepID=A0A1I8HDJ6_9PLAT
TGLFFQPKSSTARVKMSDAKEYVSKKQIPQLFECLMTGLMYHRPSDHIAYLQQCLDKIKVQGVSGVRWDLFLEAKRAKTPLPPVTPPRSAKRSASHTSSVSDLGEKKPVLPPIGGGGNSANYEAVEDASRQQVAAAAAVAVRESSALSDSSNLQKLTAPLTCPLVLVLGGPGSGKRVICRHLAQRYGFASLCVGDLVRNGIRDSRDASRQRWAVAAAAFERGDAVPEDLLLPALIDAVNQLVADGRCRGVFVEGYPRSPEQVDAIAEHIKQPDRALLLDFEEDLLQERLLRRYHRLGAIEDQPANIGRRIGHFRSAGLPACRIYDEARRLVVVPVDEDLDDASVFAEAARAMDAFYDPVDTSAGPKKAPKAGEGGADSRDDTEEESEAAAVSASAVTYIEEIENVPEPVKRPSDLPQCPIVLVMGGPGSGRSSQLRRVAERYAGFVHINASEEARNRSLGAGANAAWSALVDIATQGDLDEEVDAAELRRLLTEKGRGANCILLEGYPINANQLRDLYKTVGQPDLTVLLDCEETYMVRRLLARGREQGGLGDNIAAVSKRMSYFKEHTLPVVRHFDLAGKLCIVLGDRDDSEVFYDLAGLFDYVFFNQKPQHVQQDETKAAETIQAAFEGFLTRQQFAENNAGKEGPADPSKDAMDEDTAAETIQAAFDGFKTREEFVAAQQSEQQNGEEAANSTEEQQAATKIQANFRGYQTRKNLAKK